MKKTRKYKSRGGSVLDNGPAMIKTMGTMLSYGVSAILIGPLYLIAEILNAPLSSLNNLSRKAFDKNKKHKFLHMPMYKMIKGCTEKTLNPDKFILQDDMYIHNDVAVISCDSEAKNNGVVKDYSTNFTDSFLNFFGLIRSERKLRHHVLRLFEYIENLRDTDEERKIHLQKLITQISNYRTLIKCYLIYRSLSDKCSGIKSKSTKTILKDEDIVHIVNPFYQPGSESYTTRLKCITKHITQKRFDDADKLECKAQCNTCTFRNSLSRLTRKLSSVISSGGCRISMITSMMNSYYKYISATKGTSELPKDEKGVIPYLDKFKVTSLLQGAKIDDEELVLEKFNLFMCKYDIVDALKHQIEKIIKKKLDAGYPMDQLLTNLETTSRTLFSFK